MSGVQVEGESSVIQCSDSSAVTDCFVRELKNLKIEALLDTGSQVSLIHASLLTPDLLKKSKLTRLTLRTVNQQKLHVTKVLIYVFRLRETVISITLLSLTN